MDVPLGAGLVEELTRVEVADADDAELLDAAARWQEVISWATAMQSRAMNEIARRRSWTEEHDAATAEVSARLRVPQGEASKHMARGTGLAQHPQVMDALYAACIDVAKADILLRSGNPLTTEERDEAINRYLPEAPDRTRRWLRDKMNAFAARLHGVNEGARRAVTRRAVYLDPADNSMAWISANLPADEAAAVWDAVDTTAHVLRRAPGATRTLAQARADALVAITTGRIVVPPLAECSERTAHAPGDDETPPRTTVPASGCTCGGCTCGGTTVRVLPVTAQVRVTVPASMLLGLDDTPGHLDGYGPIPAGLAARIATDATWQRLVTDPVTGILADYSTTTYQPGKLLRRAVTSRDETCTFPQCERPARWSDLDHIHPFDHDLRPEALPQGTPGQTRAANLQPLCRAHHLAKTHHGWQVERDPASGVTVWTAPTGHRYTRPPTVTDTAHPYPHAPTPPTVVEDVTSVAAEVRHLLGRRDRPEPTRDVSEPCRATPRPGALPDTPPF